MRRRRANSKCGRLLLRESSECYEDEDDEEAKAKANVCHDKPTSSTVDLILSFLPHRVNANSSWL